MILRGSFEVVRFIFAGEFLTRSIQSDSPSEIRHGRFELGATVDKRASIAVPDCKWVTARPTY